MSAKIGWIPPAIFAFILTVLMLFHPYLPPVIFDPPVLAPVVNTLLLSSTALALAYISVRGYLSTGSSSLLLLGNGVIASSLTNVVAFLIVGASFLNVSVTMSNCGALLASMFHMANVFLTLAEVTIGTRPKRRRLGVILLYFGVFTFIALLAIASFLRVLPPFYLSEIGFTELRWAVFETTMLLLVLSSTAFMMIHVKSRTGPSYWYSLALVLFTIGFFASFLSSPGSPIDWLARSALYLSNIYFLAVAYSAIRSSKPSPTHASEMQVPIERKKRRKHQVERGCVYIIKDEIEEAYRAFSEAVLTGAEGLIITREYPANINRKYRLENTLIVWITSEKDEKQQTVNSLQDISILITNFLEKSRRAIILLDGIEYLITNSGFEPVLRFLQSKRSQMEIHEAAFMIPISTKTLQPEQYKLIERETKMLPQDSETETN